MTETSTDPAATLRRAARVAHTVGLSEYSTVVASAREVLSLAEQQEESDA